MMKQSGCIENCIYSTPTLTKKGKFGFKKPISLLLIQKQNYLKLDIQKVQISNVFGI